MAANAAVQHVQCSFNFERDNFAHVAQGNMRRCEGVCSRQPQDGACRRQQDDDNPWRELPDRQQQEAR